MFATRLRHKTYLVGTIWQFDFDVPHGFTWHGGDHCVLILEQAKTDDRGNARPLSIATIPKEETVRFVTHIPDVHSAFKQALLDMNEGDPAILTLAQPSFHIDMEKPHHTFVAGGIGCASVRALLMEWEENQSDLVAAVRYYALEGQHIFQSDLSALAQRHASFHVEYLTLSQLEEQGSIKEEISETDTQYVFSGVYTQRALQSGETTVESGESHDEARKEVELLTKASGLMR